MSTHRNTQLNVYPVLTSLGEVERLASMDPNLYFDLLALVKEEFAVTDAYL